MAQNLTGETTLPRDVGGDVDRATGLQLLIMSPDVFCAIPLPDAGTLTIGRSESADIHIHDPLASRKHAILHVGPKLSIEDLGSANGTRLRDDVLAPGARISLSIGDAIFVGQTCLMLQQNMGPTSQGRVWSHSYFESRLEEECARAKIAGATFTVAQLNIASPASWIQVLPILIRELEPPHLLGAYGPSDYEVLFCAIDTKRAEALMSVVSHALAGVGLSARFGIAQFPRDGATGDTLIASARAKTRVAVHQEPSLVSPLDVKMAKLHEMAARAAASTINILILGETGVGKEVMAQSIHRLSPRHDKPMVCLNCAGLSESLLESELFGYERGAFTGATHAKAGLLESADGGTVFLDEIGDLPPAIQGKLLRTIEQRQVTRLGSLKPITLDVRFVSATNKDLEAEQSATTFRRDLFFRLNGITLTIPPLRERRSEIPFLARHFAQAAGRQLQPPQTIGILARALELLTQYDWPGNVRELKNVIERAVVLSNGAALDFDHLPLDRLQRIGAVASRTQSAAMISGVWTTQNAVPDGLSRKQELERERILEALAACAGNQSRAARLLGIARRTLVSKLEVYQIPRPQK